MLQVVTYATDNISVSAHPGDDGGTISKYKIITSIIFQEQNKLNLYIFFALMWVKFTKFVTTYCKHERSFCLTLNST